MEELKTRKQQNSLLLSRVDELAESMGLCELTRKNYTTWILRFLRFHSKRSPKSMGKPEVEAFLSFLADELNYAQIAQETARKALSFLYNDFLKVKFENLHYSRLKKRRDFFSKFGKNHCYSVLERMNGTTQLMTKLALSANLRLREVINLKVADIDLKKNQIALRKPGNCIASKNHKTHSKSNIVYIPVHLILDLRIQIMKVHHLVRREKEKMLEVHTLDFTILAEQLAPESQFLFPYSHHKETKRATLQLAQTPLPVLKNDIQIAINSYRRFLPDVNSTRPNIRVPTPIKYRRMNQDCTQPGRLTLTKNFNRQIPFNFENEFGAG